MGICGSSLIQSDNTTPKYSFENTWFIGKCISVYDGDTFTMVTYLCDGTNTKLEPRQVKVRCYGYDSPEMKPLLTTPNREEVISNANKAKTYVERCILNKLIVVHCKGFDKYGRFLGDVYYMDSYNLDFMCSGCIPKFVEKDFVKDNEMKYLNKEMIDKGFGKVYFGGTKEVLVSS